MSITKKKLSIALRASCAWYFTTPHYTSTRAGNIFHALEVLPACAEGQLLIVYPLRQFTL